MIDLFEEVQRHELSAAGQPPASVTTDLTQLQRTVLWLLGMPKTYDG